MRLKETGFTLFRAIFQLRIVTYNSKIRNILHRGVNVFAVYFHALFASNPGTGLYIRIIKRKEYKNCIKVQGVMKLIFYLLCKEAKNSVQKIRILFKANNKYRIQPFNRPMRLDYFSFQNCHKKAR